MTMKISIKDRFPKGSRVRLSALGAYHASVDLTRVGAVLGWSRDRRSVRLMWDGSRTGETYSESFLERVIEEVTR